MAHWYCISGETVRIRLTPGFILTLCYKFIGYRANKFFEIKFILFRAVIEGYGLQDIDGYLEFIQRKAIL